MVDMLELQIRKYKMYVKIYNLHKEQYKFEKCKLKKMKTSENNFEKKRIEKNIKCLHTLCNKYTKNMSKMKRKWYYDPNTFEDD